MTTFTVDIPVLHEPGESAVQSRTVQSASAVHAQITAVAQIERAGFTVDPTRSVQVSH